MNNILTLRVGGWNLPLYFKNFLDSNAPEVPILYTVSGRRKQILNALKKYHATAEWKYEESPAGGLAGEIEQLTLMFDTEESLTMFVLKYSS